MDQNTISRGGESTGNLIRQQSVELVAVSRLSHRKQKLLSRVIHSRQQALGCAVDSVKGNRYLEKKFASLYDMRQTRVCKASGSMPIKHIALPPRFQGEAKKVSSIFDNFPTFHEKSHNPNIHRLTDETSEKWRKEIIDSFDL